MHIGWIFAIVFVLGAGGLYGVQNYVDKANACVNDHCVAYQK